VRGEGLGGRTKHIPGQEQLRGSRRGKKDVPNKAHAQQAGRGGRIRVDTLARFTVLIFFGVK